MRRSRVASSRSNIENVWKMQSASTKIVPGTDIPQINNLVNKISSSKKVRILKKLRTDPRGFFSDEIATIKEEVLASTWKTSILILSPFLYKKFVYEFVEKIVKNERLKGKLGPITVVTRPPENVKNPDEHLESIKILLEAGVNVCISKAKSFHAKAVVINTEKLIAGSLNPLAPSYNEFPIKIPLPVLLENPRAAKALWNILTKTECITKA